MCINLTKKWQQRYFDKQSEIEQIKSIIFEAGKNLIDSKGEMKTVID